MSSSLIEHLVDLYKDESRVSERNAAFAHLRRGLSNLGGRYEAFRHVEHFTLKCDSHQRECHYLVAGLFAAHPSHSEEKHFSLGQSLALLRAKRGDSIDRRFHALLDSLADDVADHLRHAVSLLKSETIPVNYSQLLWDLQNWTDAEKPVQLKWARDYWREADSQTNTSLGPEESQTDSAIPANTEK